MLQSFVLAHTYKRQACLTGHLADTHTHMVQLVTKANAKKLVLDTEATVLKKIKARYTGVFCNMYAEFLMCSLSLTSPSLIVFLVLPNLVQTSGN